VLEAAGEFGGGGVGDGGDFESDLCVRRSRWDLISGYR
jgi:hypothetical protein